MIKMQLLEIIVSVLAAILVMILHELPKSIVVLICRNKQLVASAYSMSEQRKQEWRNIFKIHNYIDPIGLLLCVTIYTGFSKSYMYRIRSMRTNFLVGITGFLSLLLTFFISIFILKYAIGLQTLMGKTEIAGGFWSILTQLFFIYMALFSIGMFIVNLFPISVFDMGLIFAGKQPTLFLSVIKNDTLIKIILLVVFVIGVIRNISFLIMEGFLVLF